MGADLQETKSILVIEDDPAIREVLTQILELEGYTVTCVKDGRDAMNHLRRAGRPDLILLDLMMPVMDGWQFRTEQKRDPELASIPVVVISADGNIRQKAASLDAADCLQKPIELYELLGVIQRHSGT